MVFADEASYSVLIERESKVEFGLSVSYSTILWFYRIIGSPLPARLWNFHNSFGYIGCPFPNATKTFIFVFQDENMAGKPMLLA